MLGSRVSDELGSEEAAGTVLPGLGLLPVETSFASLAEKTTQRGQVQVHMASLRGLFAQLSDQRLAAYQIHLGRTSVVKETEEQMGTIAFEITGADKDGWLDAGGWCAGCYLHGLFENDSFRHSIITALAQRRSSQSLVSNCVSFDRQAEYDKLANLLRKHLDMQHLKQLCGLVD